MAAVAMEAWAMAMEAQAMAMAVAMVDMVMAAAAHCAVEDTGLMASTEDLMQRPSLPNQKDVHVFSHQGHKNVFKINTLGHIYISYN